MNERIRRPALPAVARVLTLSAAVALLGSGVPTTRAHAQASVTPVTLDRNLSSSLRWRNIGPMVGGRSIAVGGSTARPLEYYFGAVGGGLWKTTDAGTTWTAVTDGQVASSSVGSIGICEDDPDVVYVGMGEGQFRAQINTGDGVYGTRDGGKTWTHLGLRSSSEQQTVARLRVHPQDCNVVYAAVLGDPYGPNRERGVYRTRDGGRNWERVLFRSEAAGASDLMLDPSDPRVIYATIWDVVRPPWGGITRHESGIFKSTDGGDTWTEITRNPGLPQGRIGKVGISVSAADPNRVYAVIEADPESGGGFRSDNAGRTWTRTNGNTTLFHRAEYYIRIYADPQDVDRVFVLNRNFYHSEDGGKTYTQIRVPHGDNHDLWIAPNDNRRMINANDGGANVSMNRGQTWTGQQYPTAQIYHLTTTNDWPYLVCGAQQDNTSKCLPSDGDGTFWFQGPAGEQGHIAMHPVRTTLGWGGSQRGGLTRFDRATGQRVDVDVWPDMSDGEVPNQLRERFQWTYPIVLSPQDPDVLYASSQHVWRTRDGGLNWERISPDLTRADPRTLRGSDQPVNDHSGTDYYATIFTLAPSPHDANTLWAGSDDGLIHVTRDGGRNWTNVTPAGYPEFTKANLITVSPHQPGKALLAAQRNKLQDVAPYIYKTDDYGQSWSVIVDGIPLGHFVYAVREDPVRPGLLYAATEHGVHISFDDGANWQSLTLNLPNTPVSFLVVKDNDLVISTFGRGIYILDDMSALRQLPEAAGRRAHLFRPADVVRTSARQLLGVEYRRTRLPGANAVNVHYLLREPARQVTIEVLNDRGETIRTFAGSPHDRRWIPMVNSTGHVINGPSWGSASRPPPVRIEAGLHRFAWDLKMPPATDFPGLRLRGTNVDGPMLPPGTYRVRLTVDGETQEQTVQVHKDPRLTEVTQADLEAQFAVAMRAHQRLNDATSAVAHIREIKAQVDDRLRQVSDARLATAGQTLKARLSEIEGEIYQVRIEAQSDIKHFGPRITNKLASVYAMAKSGDAPPASQTVAVLEELSGRLDEQLARLDGVLRRDLAQFNSLLARRNLTAVAFGRRGP